MKAITLHQPWASLVALGIKTIETRSWSTKYRGPLAIHAGTHRPEMMHLPEMKTCPDRFHESCWHWLVIDTITAPEHQRPHRTDIRDWVPKWATTPTLFFPRRGPHGRPHQEGTPATEQGSAVYLPLGAVVATCELVDVVSTYGQQTAIDLGRADDLPYGDFSPGRFAWLLDNIKPLDEPVQAKGRQGLWEWSA